MANIKIIGAVSGFVILAGVAGGYGLMKYNAPAERNVKSSSEVAGVQSTGSPRAISEAVPLNQTAATPPAASGLQVGNNTGATSVNQGGSNQLAVGPTGTTSAPAGNTNPFDPKTFADYEKYKPDTSALFADVLVGEGAVLEANKKAAVYYRGWLTNGTVFDESRMGADGKMTPFIFTLGAGQVIPGWEQALAGMKVGGVRLVIVPPAAGYKDQEQNGIPPNSVLVFQVQLAEVQ